MESLYWVFTLKCNDQCDHCYNSSGPTGEIMEAEELLKVVPNLPDRIERIILSGGEPLMEMDKLIALLQALRQRYGRDTALGLQSNGDLLDAARLERLLTAEVDRLDIASLDLYHRARGRALENGQARLDPEHDFRTLWSGAIGFLDDGSDRQEVHIQLSQLYPCCPTMLFCLGDVRQAPVAQLLDRVRGIPAFQRLNRGEACGPGRDEGLTADYIRARVQALRDVCLWCDGFFQRHYTGPRGARRRGLPNSVQSTPEK